MTEKEICVSVVSQCTTKSEDDDQNLIIKFGKSSFDWPDMVGLEDLKNVADLSDFHIVFTFDAWMRGACKDAMACKIG